MTVLVVDDERKMAELLRRGLAEAGFAVDLAETGGATVAKARDSEYEAIVLDVQLPGVDGIETCRRLRGDGFNGPLVLLSARGSIEDRRAGMDAGADAYLLKPFSLEELVGWVRDLIDDRVAGRHEFLEAGDLRLDVGARRAWRGDAEMTLTEKEFALLEVLLRNAGLILTPDQVLDQAVEGDLGVSPALVKDYVSRLRRKIDEPFGIVSVETVRGAGYRFRVDGGRQAARV